MSVQILNLNANQLSGMAQSLIYPPAPITLTTIVKSITVVNTDTQPRTINLYFAPAGVAANARRIAPQNMTIPAGGMAIADQEITMGSTDTLLGDASVGGKLDYVISGIQR